LSSSHISSLPLSPSAAVSHVAVDAPVTGSRQSSTAVSVTSEPVDSGHYRQSCADHHNEDGNVDSLEDHRSFDYGGSATFLSCTTINDDDDVVSQRSRAESAEQQRRHQLGRLLERENFAAVNADVLEHIYDEYGVVERIGTVFPRGEDTRIASTQTREVKWEMKTVF